jgi:hypothetical protein
MLKRKETSVFFVLIFVCVAGYGLSAIRMQAFRDTLDPTQVVSALQVKPEVLEIAGGEFRSLLADYLLLKASVYLGGRYSTPEPCKQAVSILFRQSAALDPYFFQTCYFTQAHLPWWRGELLEDALDIIEIFHEHRDWHWEPGFYLGFDYFYFLKDNQMASKYLMEASKRPYAPPLVGFLGTRLAQRSGKTSVSIAFLQSMYESTENETAKEEIARRIEALKGVLILEKGISQYSSGFGHPPESLEQLTATGILKTLPINPARQNGTYLYKNGKIDF